MALFTAESIERVKDAVDMLELVGARTELRRAGTQWMGRCPFHDERTPSFSVNAQDKLYYCFGCQESGDAIKFVEQTEALDFPQAVEFLGDRYGVELEREKEDPRAEERRRRRDRLLALLERVTTFYERFLWEADESEKARNYLASRGLSEAVLRDFRIGYAPSAWDRVLTAAQRDGFKPDELAAAGLVKQGRRGGIYDAFRERITFPLADGRGRVLGFGARAMRDDQMPKYVNTAETELYRKGRQLFGLDRARAPAAKAGRVVVVEGYTDVLALHQSGVTESVAVMGTALTSEQFAQLARTAPSVLLALDPDRSGQEAMRSVARGADERGVELRVVELPEGRDPAELVAESGGEAFGSLLGSTLSVPEFEARRVIAEADLSTPHGKDKALNALRPVIASVPEKSATRDELVRFASDRLDVPSEFLVTTLASPPGSATRRPSGEPLHLATADAVVRAERTFLAMCVGLGADGKGYLERIGDDHLSTGSLRRAREWLLAHFDSPLSDLPSDDPTLVASVSEIVMRADEESAERAVLELGVLQLDLRRVDRHLRDADRAGDHARQAELRAERERLREQIDTAMGEAT